MTQQGFSVDDAPLRAWILKAYHAHQAGHVPSDGILESIRQFLSGPLGDEGFHPRYWFEDHPTSAVGELIADLETHWPKTARLTFEPLFAAVQESNRAGTAEIAPNVGVFVASLAGSLAIKSGMDETLACALLSTALLGLARLGVTPFRSAVSEMS